MIDDDKRKLLFLCVCVNISDLLLSPLCCHGEHLLTFTSHVIACPPPVLCCYRRYLHCEALVVSAQLVPLNLACYHL